MRSSRYCKTKLAFAIDRGGHVLLVFGNPARVCIAKLYVSHYQNIRPNLYCVFRS